jgi:hypothetical protein
MYRSNPQGIPLSVCKKCFCTVATSLSLSILQEAERRHICQRHDTNLSEQNSATTPEADYLSRVALVTALLEHASDRIRRISTLSASEYRITVGEIKLIMVRLNELLASMPEAVASSSENLNPTLV